MTTPPLRNQKKSRVLRVAGASALSCSVMFGLAMPSAFAAEAKVELGTSSNYSVLGGQSVTNTGNSILAQDLGVSPGTSITGFPPGLVLGTTHASDAEALLAQSDLVTAYDAAAGRQPTANVSGDLAGQTLVGGVYKADSELGLSGTLTLDAQNDPNTVWIFQISSALTTGSASSVELINGAQACNVYWQVGSSATLGTDSSFKGSILALTSVTVTNEATVEGRVLARNGSVTLDDNTFIAPGCETELPTETEPEPEPEPTVPPTEPTTPPTEPTTPPTEPTPAPGDGDGSGDATPTPGDDTPTPGDDTPTPGDDTPTPGDDTPTPGEDTPTPGDDTPSEDTPTPDNGIGLGEDTPGDDTPTPDNGIGLGEDTPRSGDSSTETELAKTGASSTLLYGAGALMMLVLGTVFMVSSRKLA